MEKRTIIAIALSILVLVVFSYLTPRKPVKKQITPKQEVQQEESKEQKLQAPKDVTVPPITPEIPSQEREIRVENEVFSAVFTTRGGTIKTWELKRYTDNDGALGLVTPNPVIRPISIIPAEQLGMAPPKRNYLVDTDEDTITLGYTTDKKSLTFFYSDPSGLAIKKTFTFYKEDYRVDVSIEVTGIQSYYVVLGSEFGVFDAKGTWVHIGPVLLKDNKKIDIDRKNIEGIGFIRRMTGTKSRDEVVYRDNIHWIAQEDKYFTSALVPMDENYDVRIWRQRAHDDRKEESVEIAFKVEGQKGNFLLYAGPKQFEILKALGVGLEHIVDFGAFSIIARPLFWLLKYFYKVIGNYGWAIVLLTIVVRIPFIPLLNKSQKSMKRLQEIQPHMAAVKEKHKKDPQKAQKEMMSLYKKHKVNPMGGCLPMLIQLPVFLALYKILLIAIELKGAPFILWITDLSVKDPYYVFPIVMGLSMVIQQKMTPSSMDPKQAKIMMLMPVVFTFMFLSFPAGLVLYWLVNNALGIVQQLYINKKSKKPA
jgi:YidC/Oxa1 family membrane protein insertase